MIQSLTNLLADNVSYQDHSAFIDKYLKQEDGKSTEKVVNFLLGNQRFERQESLIESAKALVTDSVLVYSDIPEVKGSHVIQTRIITETEEVNVLKQACLVDKQTQEMVGGISYYVEWLDGVTGWLVESDLTVNEKFTR